jgi:hypothetical protein
VNTSRTTKREMKLHDGVDSRLLRNSTTADQPFVVGVRTDPEPRDDTVRLDSDSPVMAAHARDPELVDLLEMEGGMPVVDHPEPVVLVREPLDSEAETIVKMLEPARGPRSHSGKGRVFPALYSSMASSASLSSLPARMSCSICRSHSSPRFWITHSESFQNSGFGNCSIARVMSSTVLMGQCYRLRTSLSIRIPRPGLVGHRGRRILPPLPDSGCNHGRCGPRHPERRRTSERLTLNQQPRNIEP